MDDMRLERVQMSLQNGMKRPKVQEGRNPAEKQQLLLFSCQVDPSLLEAVSVRVHAGQEGGKQTESGVPA